MPKEKTSGEFFGKYREIVLAVAFFLVFDLAVLLLNFYTSYQIAEDAVSINLAGRQRMLSQRMTKALLLLQTDRQANADSSGALDEVRTTVKLFSATLEGFRVGGEVTGGDSKPVHLNAVTTSGGQGIIHDALAVWMPYQLALQPVLAGNADDAALAAAIGYARGNNLKLLALMNALTSDLEGVASAKADRLRAVQTGGIVLALLNFAFILFKFIRKLRESDRLTEVAQKETGEILGTLKDGLFLLDHDGKVGLLHSASLESILRHAIAPGADFMALLQSMLPDDTFATARDYIGLLFGDRVRENLVTSLNPLVDVRVATPGIGAPCYLSFHFNRVMAAGKVAHLLVTVIDVSEKILLAKQLEVAQAEREHEMEILLDLLKVHPGSVRQFLEDAELGLNAINDRLREGAAEPDGVRVALDAAFRSMHTIKGNAAALGLDLFEQQAHDFELALVELRREASPTGEALLQLAVKLEAFFQRLTLVRNIFNRLAEHYGSDATSNPAVETEELVRHLEGLARRIADDHQRQVKLEARLSAFPMLPTAIKSGLSEIAIQLVRNAVVHGIEPPVERSERFKAPVGRIELDCRPAEGGEFEFVLRDDGRGLSPDAVREALVRSGRFNPMQVQEFSDRQILMQIFEPGFSTLQHATKDAGHGFGMDVVKARIQQLGAHLTITSRPDRFTEFRIRFAA